MKREITVQELAARLAANEPTVLVDVREPWENTLAALPESILIPLGELAERVDEVTQGFVVVYCHHGVRSLSGAAILGAAGVPALSLAGGIDLWSRAIDPKIRRY